MNEIDEILVVDDEASVGEVVSLYLKREGYQVRIARDGRQALTEIERRPPTLVILNLMLPHISNLEIMRRLRLDFHSTVPVIMLTARRQETDRIYGLELGADDYVIKPFSPAELVARVKAVLRRTKGNSSPGIKEQKRLEFAGLTIDPLTRQVVVKEEIVDLTATEFNLLYFLGSHPRQVFSRDQLLEKVWGFSEYVDPSTVTVHIRRLREKVEIDPSQPQHLLTVWGVGYKFEPG